MFTFSCSAFASTDLHTLFQSYVALSAPVIAGLDVQMPPWLGDVSGIVLAAFATCLSCLFALASPLTYLCDLLFKLGSMIGSKMGWKCWGIGALVAEAKTAVAANAQDEAQRELEDHYAPADEQEESDDAAIGEMEKGSSKEELVSAVKSDQGTSQAVYTPLETVTCMNERDQDGGVRTPMDEPTVCFRTRAFSLPHLPPEMSQSPFLAVLSSQVCYKLTSDALRAGITAGHLRQFQLMPPFRPGVVLMLPRAPRFDVVQHFCVGSNPVLPSSLSVVALATWLIKRESKNDKVKLLV